MRTQEKKKKLDYVGNVDIVFVAAEYFTKGDRSYMPLFFAVNSPTSSQSCI